MLVLEVVPGKCQTLKIARRDPGEKEGDGAGVRAFGSRKNSRELQAKKTTPLSCPVLNLKETSSDLHFENIGSLRLGIGVTRH